MQRLTYIKPDGTLGVVGMNEDNRDTKAYVCIAKLKDYENTGLEPDEVEHCVSPTMLDLMKHAIGYAQRKVKRGKYCAYRNYFVSSPVGNKHLDRAVEMGLAIKRHSEESKSIIYHLTADGIYYLSRILDVTIYEED